MLNSTSDIKSPLQGGCFCKMIRYEISDPIIKTGVCHCYSCQHLTGGSSWPFIVAKVESLNIIGNLKEFAREGESGQKVHMGFCANCGSTLFGRAEIWPHIRTISTSSLDDSKCFIPNMHVWTEHAQSWVVLDSNIQQFSKNPTPKND